jgi:DNA-binding NtrC family response regulator
MSTLRVLVVDDEQELVGALVERLQLRRIEARGVTSAKTALEVMAQQAFDVVLLDVKMPGMGGVELAKIIKSRWPQLQVVLLTGHGSHDDAEEGLRVGAFQYLMKPVSIEELIEVLQDAFQEGSESGTTGPAPRGSA